MIIPRPSPHHNARAAPIDCIVLHADAGRTEEGTLAWLADPASRVSYHYLIGRTGTVYRCVPDRRRAWHAGKSEFRGRANVNDFSLGVAFANNQRGEPFPAVQIEAGIALLRALVARHRVPLDRVTTHAAIAPGRKVDPGALFPLAAVLARLG